MPEPYIVEALQIEVKDDEQEAKEAHPQRYIYASTPVQLFCFHPLLPLVSKKIGNGDKAANFPEKGRFWRTPITQP
jgi:hypothetical protein